MNEHVPKETDSETGQPVPEVVGDGDGGIALSASQQFFGRAPFVVLAPEDDHDAIVRGASLAVATSVPLLVVGPADEASIAQELGRLNADTAVAVGSVPAIDGADILAIDGSPEQLSELTGLTFRPEELSDISEAGAALAALDSSEHVLLTIPSAVVEPSENTGDGSVAATDATLPSFGRGSQDTQVVVFTSPNGVPEPGERADHVAATAVAKAAGAQVVVLPVPDPRVNRESVDAVRENADATILALGSHFGTSAQIRERIDSALNVAELPGGGQLIYPGRRMIALYGHPGVPAMGVLGEQGPEDAIARARELAGLYEDYSGEAVIPALEVIVTVASVSPGADNQYSNVSRVEDIRPWVDAARDEGTYIVLDLQPGRTDFLTQAKLFEELLAEPHVGLALDPEWRLRPDQVHLRQVGQVDASEVNEVIEWLADLTAEHNLPQKLLVLHQFQTRMITNRDQLDTSREEVSLLIHADGHGVPAQKMDTWNVLKQDLSDDIWLGWKNFYDEDSPTFTPAETMYVEPAPWFVSYQ
ncbi:hypothetical protein AS9A_3307 [Hoyosella subflava DQS3-9A1]|uniref:Lipoprotein n=1 Tax=Hoyosella subflava (strain DSM 45089 / JCM 17490 / NBRC 109087 / DQS3-9A1) TaxID=443218 RepID=F6EP89_HOYSD|nr:hypothetical protein AS9A_3307 [Hoyosella subflava DQS3-9A1]